MSLPETLDDLLVMDAETPKPKRAVVIADLQLPLLYLYNELFLFDDEIAEREVLPFLVGEVFPELSVPSATTTELMVMRLTGLGMISENAHQVLQRGLILVINAITEHLPNTPSEANLEVGSGSKGRKLRVVAFGMRGKESVQLTLEVVPV